MYGIFVFNRHLLQEMDFVFLVNDIRFVNFHFDFVWFWNFDGVWNFLFDNIWFWYWDLDLDWVWFFYLNFVWFVNGDLKIDGRRENCLELSN